MLYFKYNVVLRLNIFEMTKKLFLNLGLLVGLIFLLNSCANETPTKKEVEATPSQQEVPLNTSEQMIDYPADLDKVFDNHGTLNRWKSMKSMTYEIVKEGGNEKQQIDLYNRAERIDGSAFSSGYDGEKYWVVADTSYKGNPKFYTNLIFYFYAMPFVIADEGINYNKVEPIVFEGKSYPGYRISYDNGVGISPKDEYFIHYDAETYEMQWLGYTVTYFSGEKGTKTSWIRYNDWKDFNGLKLPNSLSWYKSKDGEITELRNTRNFANVTVSSEVLSKETFQMPEGAKEAK